MEALILNIAEQYSGRVCALVARHGWTLARFLLDVFFAQREPSRPASPPSEIKILSASTEQPAFDYEMVVAEWDDPEGGQEWTS